MEKGIIEVNGNDGLLGILLYVLIQVRIMNILYGWNVLIELNGMMTDGVHMKQVNGNGTIGGNNENLWNL